MCFARRLRAIGVLLLLSWITRLLVLGDGAKPPLAYLAPVPIVTGLTFLAVWRGLASGRERQPFLLSILLFILGFLGQVLSIFPAIVPPDLTIWQAANSPQSQTFLLIGFAFAIPATLAYNAYGYWVFRGKVAEDLSVTDYH